jgi:hypothetical protein
MSRSRSPGLCALAGVSCVYTGSMAMYVSVAVCQLVVHVVACTILQHHAG